MKFSEMIAYSPYEYTKNITTTYGVYIDKQRQHWFLLLKMKDSTLPFFSLEASTPDLSSLRHEMFLFDPYKGKATFCGEITFKLLDILLVADKIVTEMKVYSLFSSNCQHFCNNFLNHYGFDTFPPTFGKEVTAEIRKQPIETEEDRSILQLLDALNDVIKNPLSSAIRKEEARIKRHFASALNAYVGADN